MGTFVKVLRPTLVCFVALAALASVAVADTVKIGYNDPIVAKGNGGQFLISNFNNGGGIVNTLKKDGVEFTPLKLSSDSVGSFSTFCIEHNEEFSPGSSYDYVVKSYAEKGGVGGQEFPNQDPVGYKTALLYYAFITNQLHTYVSDYIYHTGMANDTNNASAGALQNAIWVLEGEISNTFASGSLEDKLITFANGADPNKDYGVYALNLSTGVGDGKKYYQSQLVATKDIGRVPAPAAGILALLGFGLFGWYRRRSAV